MSDGDNVNEPTNSPHPALRPFTLHPFVCGLAWAALMGGIGLIFLGVEYIKAVIASEPSARFIANDQPLSFAILLIVSFLFGFSAAWFQRRRRTLSKVEI